MGTGRGSDSMRISTQNPRRITYTSKESAFSQLSSWLSERSLRDVMWN